MTVWAHCQRQVAFSTFFGRKGYHILSIVVHLFSYLFSYKGQGGLVCSMASGLLCVIFPAVAVSSYS